MMYRVSMLIGKMQKVVSTALLAKRCIDSQREPADNMQAPNVPAATLLACVRVSFVAQTCA